ncbi:MAG: universal stress protein [Pseudomonadota bacterium]|jgi:nucleotide-binding universal stress UspA family protein
MKSILVALSGTKSDDAVLEAAYAVARPLNAHLHFFHIPIDKVDPADYNPHIDFARGSAVDFALREELANAEDAVTRAHAHVTRYCKKKEIAIVSLPAAKDRVTASWSTDPVTMSVDGLIKAARTHDLTIVGRSATGRSWSQNLLEALATQTGRPILIVPPGCREMTFDTVAVWWKDHAAAARALTAAMPLLNAAERVVVLSVAESTDSAASSLDDLKEQLAWNGIETVTQVHERDHRSTIRRLWTSTLIEGADLVVMGGFSRSRIKEFIFGGCTQSVLDDNVRPVFLLH